MAPLSNHPLPAIGTLESNQVFQQKGWHLEPGILDPKTVDDVRQFLHGRYLLLKQRFEAWAQTSILRLEDYTVQQNKIAEYEKKGLPKDLRHFLTGEFDLETRLQHEITDLLVQPTFRKYMGAFLRTETVFAHFPPMIRFKVPEAQNALVPLHQDMAYNQHMADFVTVWIPFSDVGSESGGIAFYEGSQHLGLVDHKPEGAWSNRAAADLNIYPKQRVPMKAGDALLFSPLVLHESEPYLAREIRFSIDFRLFWKENYSTKSYFDCSQKIIKRVD